MYFIGDGHQQEPLLGCRVPDGQQVSLLRDLSNRAVDVIHGHLARYLWCGVVRFRVRGRTRSTDGRGRMDRERSMDGFEGAGVQLVVA